MHDSIDGLMSRAQPRADALDRERIASEVSKVLFERGAPPVEVGRFVVEARVGSGGMGIVYRGYDPELDRKVAIKVLDLRRIGARRGPAHARLPREARALARLTPPTVVSVHDLGVLADPPGESSEDESRLYLVMEYVDGPNLRRWMQGERNLDERLALVLAAGRGLAAAHEAGLMHGDFKPENILVGDDGRARVADFGLALPMLAFDEENTRDGRPKRVAECPGLDSVEQPPEVTISAVFGTPAYIAPEQFVRPRLDARADQFAFCVVACELLYGRRPFTGDSLAALRGAALAGEIEPLDDPRIPRRVAAVLRTGLAADPGARFADMPQLLARLEAAFERRPPWRWMAASLVVVGGVAGVSAASMATEPAAPASSCVAAEVRLEPIWSQDRADAIEARLRTARAASAAPLVDRLEDQVQGWGRAWTESCAAQTDAATRERMQTCLDARLLELEAVVEALADPGREYEAPLAVLDRLTPVATCLDHASLDATRPVPMERDRRRAVEEVRNRLIAEATLATRLGRADEALAHARTAVERARSLDFRPLEAEAHLALGQALQRAERLEEAAEVAEQAHLIAEASRHVATLADAALLRVALAYEAAELDEGRAWLAKAEAANEATGGDPTRAVELRGVACMLELLAGELDAALAHCERARGLIDEGARIDGTTRVRIAINFATAEQGVGLLERADRSFARAEAAARAELGPSHPWLIHVLLNWGHVALERGELDRALDRYRGAEALVEQTELAHGRTAGAVHVSLADALRERGRLDEAELEYRRALEIAAAIDDYWTAHVARSGLARLALERGRVEAARDAWAAQLVDERDRLEPAHPWRLELEVNLGAARALAGEVDEGLAQIDAAIAILEHEHGPDHPELVDDLWVRGHVARVLGRCRRGLADLDRAHALELARSGRGSSVLAEIEVERRACQLDLGRDPGPVIAALEPLVELFDAAPVRAREGLARFELGRAYLRAGRGHAGRRELVRARELLRVEKGDHRRVLDAIAELLDQP